MFRQTPHAQGYYAYVRWKPSHIAKGGTAIFLCIELLKLDAQPECKVHRGGRLVTCRIVIEGVLTPLFCMYVPASSAERLEWIEQCLGKATGSLTDS